MQQIIITLIIRQMPQIILLMRKISIYFLLSRHINNNKYIPSFDEPNSIANKAPIYGL
jgi:hypothetical protein